MPDGVIAELTKQYGVYAYAGDVLGYLDWVARALEAVEERGELWEEGAGREGERVREGGRGEPSVQ